MADESKAKKKRLVKNPDTFRERAIKAVEAGEKPSKIGRVKSASGKVVGPVARPIGSGARSVANFKAFAPVRTVLHLIGKIIFPAYFRNSWRELRQVEWPSWKQGRQLTFAVLIFAIIFGATIALVDYGLDKVFRNVLLK